MPLISAIHPDSTRFSGIQPWDYHDEGALRERVIYKEYLAGGESLFLWEVFTMKSNRIHRLPTSPGYRYYLVQKRDEFGEHVRFLGEGSYLKDLLVSLPEDSLECQNLARCLARFQE
jgi:hypothetical protein